MFNNSYIYIDEFAGFTKQEYKIILNLLRCANKVSITICTDNLDYFKSSENDIFKENKNTVKKLLDLAKENNISIDESYELKEIHRFKNEKYKCNIINL